MYSLFLNEDNRVLSATFEKYNDKGVKASILPDGNLYDYKYINNEFIYEPLVKQEDILNDNRLTIEERLTAIERNNEELTLAFAELYGGSNEGGII